MLSHAPCAILQVQAKTYVSFYLLSAVVYGIFLKCPVPGTCSRWFWSEGASF